MSEFGRGKEFGDSMESPEEVQRRKRLEQLEFGVPLNLVQKPLESRAFTTESLDRVKEGDESITQNQDDVFALLDLQLSILPPDKWDAAYKDAADKLQITVAEVGKRLRDWVSGKE